MNERLVEKGEIVWRERVDTVVGLVVIIATIVVFVTIAVMFKKIDGLLRGEKRVVYRAKVRT